MTGPYERRAFPLTLRSNGGEGPRKIVGHAAVYESDSEEMGWFTPFRERIARGAFDDALRRVASGQDAVYALLNHDENLIISSTVDGTLHLETDDLGLLAEMEPMDTQTIRDLVVTPVEQGKIRKMSFGFTVEDEHEEKRNGTLYRIIDKIGRLFDVSPVTFPAYPATDVQARRLRALGVDPARLDIRAGLAARSFLDVVRKDMDNEECRCGHIRSMHPDDGECDADDGCENYTKKAPLPGAARKAAPVPVAPAAPIGMGATRLRDLELHLRDLDINERIPTT